MQSITLKNKRYAVENLPSEPALLVQLLELCYDDNANFDMFATAIRKDLSLSAKIIQVANSPAYRQWNKISDIRRMLIVLGMSNIRSIVTTCAIQQFFSKFTKSFDKQVQFVWLRSLVCANLSERIAKLIGYDKPGEAFLAGLLHQVGILLLLINNEREYLPLLKRYYQETDDFCELERQELRVDHCELGAALTANWGFDSFIADAIQFQHEPAEELKNSPLLLKILAVAAPLSSKNSARNNPIFLHRAGQLFNMTEGTILEALDIAVEKSKQMVTDLGFSSRYYLEQNESELFDDEQHQAVTNRLGDQVRNIALSKTIGRVEKEEFSDFSQAVRTTFSTLFNSDKLLLFRRDDNRQALVPVNDLKLSQLDEITFAFDDHNSLLIKACNEGRISTSETDKGSVSDRQLIRLLGREAACFIPLNRQGKSLGIIVIGHNHGEWPALEEKTGLLKLLAGEIAGGLAKISEGLDQPPSMSMVEFRKIAHEVSNPLTIINNYLYMLGKKIDSEDPAQEELKYIGEEIERAGQILMRAKDPDARTGGSDNRVDLNRLIEEIDTLFRGSLFKTKKIESALVLDRNMPPLYCAKDKIKQILLNIIKNAAEAIDSNGRIEVTTRDNFYQGGRQYIEISIRDNGPGIPQEILNNLFQPVTSTKEGHSGLGLSIVNSLIDEMSGSISCYSRRQEGTEFKVLIPRVTEHSEDQAD